MMNRRMSIVMVAVLASLCCPGLADDLDEFVSDVDAKWVARDYTGIEQAVETRLTSHTNDLPALLLKMQYYLTVTLDVQLAQSHVPLFTNTVASIDWSSDREGEFLCQAMAEEVIDPSEAQRVGVVLGLTSNQLDQLHSECPTNHPLSPFLLRIGRIQYGD